MVVVFGGRGLERGRSAHLGSSWSGVAWAATLCWALLELPMQLVMGWEFRQGRFHGLRWRCILVDGAAGGLQVDVDSNNRFTAGHTSDNDRQADIVAVPFAAALKIHVSSGDHSVVDA